METFEKMEDVENNHVTFQDINDILKTSEYYQTLSKNEKRKLTKEKLINLFRENPLYKKHFCEEINTHKNGEKIYYPKRLIGYKIK